MKEKTLTVREVAEATGLTRSAINSRIRRGSLRFEDSWDGSKLIPESEVTRLQAEIGFEGKRSRTHIEADKGHIEFPNGEDVDLNDVDTLLIGRDLDPKQWSVESARVNEWDGNTSEGVKVFRQLRVNITRKVQSSFTPAYLPGPKFSPKGQVKRDSELIVVASDQHAPFHDEDLHEKFCRWLEVNKPDKGIIPGDLVDFGEISRHRKDPAWQASVQNCIDAGYKILFEYLSSSPNTVWQYCEGNHEARLRNILIDEVPALYGLSPALTDDPAFGLKHLLRLDELNIEYVGAAGTYEHTKIPLSNKIAVLHGHIATKGSGSSALKTLREQHHSVVQGHSHRASQVFETVYDIEGNPETLVAIEAGTMAKIKGGLGYTVNPDWQNGFCAIELWPDGRFKADLATYVAGDLFWRGERYV